MSRPIKKVPPHIARRLQKIHKLKKSVEYEEKRMIKIAYEQGASAAEIAKYVDSKRERVMRIIKNPLL